jgi:hypothetical protein
MSALMYLPTSIQAALIDAHLRREEHPVEAGSADAEHLLV